jgi:hypothetical protein
MIGVVARPTHTTVEPTEVREMGQLLAGDVVLEVPKFEPTQAHSNRFRFPENRAKLFPCVRRRCWRCIVARRLCASGWAAPVHSQCGAKQHTGAWLCAGARLQADAGRIAADTPARCGQRRVAAGWPRVKFCKHR